MPVVQVAHDLGLQGLDLGAGLADRIARHIRLVGEVDRRLHQRRGRDHALPPARVYLAERPFGLAQGLAPLCRGLGVDQVGQALDAGEVELAVLEGATGELAWLRQPAALDAADRLEHGLHHGAAAVHLQLGHVLPGLAPGRSEPQRQGVVDELARRGVPHAPEGGKAWPGPRRRHPVEHAPRRRPRYADHGHAGPAVAAGEGIDGVGRHVPATLPVMPVGRRDGHLDGSDEVSRFRAIGLGLRG